MISTMRFNISTVLRNSIEFSKAKYRTYHKLINSVCVVPFVVLNSFELVDVPVNLMITFAIIYVIVLTFKLLYRGSDTLKNVIYSCTIKGHPVSSLFWIIIGGVLSMVIVSANDKRQLQQDKEEFELAYIQYQGVIIGDVIKCKDLDSLLRISAPPMLTAAMDFAGELGLDEYIKASVEKEIAYRDFSEGRLNQKEYDELVAQNKRSVNQAVMSLRPIVGRRGVTSELKDSTYSLIFGVSSTFKISTDFSAAAEHSYTPQLTLLKTP